LLPALEVLCQESADRLSVPVNTRFAAVKLTRSAELTVFRMVQESLSNIAKYAQATRIDVQLEDLGDEALVTVSDNGVGFLPEQVAEARHGLVGMRFRVEAEQGSFQRAVGAGARRHAARAAAADRRGKRQPERRRHCRVGALLPAELTATDTRCRPAPVASAPPPLYIGLIAKPAAPHRAAPAFPSIGTTGVAMLHYAIVFFVIALIAALFGFGGIAAGAVGIAKVLFFIFVIMAIVTFLISLVRKG
jgi:uncharacterized membrane protein YtjA (UPF0391 family)